MTLPASTASPAWTHDVLGSLLGPVDRETFFADYWEQQALLTTGPPTRFATLFDHAAFEQSWHSCAGIKGRTTSPGGWPAETALRADAVPGALAAGATVCISDVQGNAALQNLCRAVGREILLAGEPSVNVYCSPDGHGFELHLDDHPVWILQIDGRKRWRYSKRPGVEQPLTTITFAGGVPAVTLPWLGTLARPDDSLFVETVLEPGDALYLPQGCWHEASAIGGSLALTLAFGRSTPLELVQQALGRTLASHPQLRWNLPGFDAGAVDRQQPPPSLEEHFTRTIQVLREALNAMTPADLYRVWQAQARRTE